MKTIFYSQSTSQSNNLAGDILKRADSFGISIFEANTWNLENLYKIAEEAINTVRSGKPAFLLIKTYRLNPHSKGDDNRDGAEIDFFQNYDRLNLILETKEWNQRKNEILTEIEVHIRDSKEEFFNISEYSGDQLPRNHQCVTTETVVNKKVRMVKALNEAYFATLEQGCVHLGEDICDPYGGAFKVSKGFSTKYPETVIGTPISEAAITGISIGMSLMGTTSFVEIMFGDFLTLCADQIINNASKMHHMYAFQANVPMRLRTPMGGKRGYGPTHSQSLEKYFLGIANFSVISLSSLVDPLNYILELDKLKGPALILENKVDYANYLWQDTPYFILKKESRHLGNLILSPSKQDPSLTIVSYGETARMIADSMEMIFDETDYVPELIALALLNPIDTAAIEKSVAKTKRIVIVEDGSIDFGIGSEIISLLVEEQVTLDSVLRIGALPVPIPSSKNLENSTLPNIDKVIDMIMNIK